MSWCWVVVVVDVVEVVVVIVAAAAVVVVVVVAVARCFVGTHARCDKPPNPDSFAARARTYAEGLSGAHKLKTMVFTMFLQQARKQKLKIRIVKRQKHCILRCFWPVGCQNSRSEKCLKHRCLQCFILLPKTKTTLCAIFSYSQYPKIKPKQWYLRCFCNSEKGVFGECRKTKSNIRIAKIQKRCILRCFFPFRYENFCFEKRPKHRNLQGFLLLPKTKQRYLRCFPSLATPK